MKKCIIILLFGIICSISMLANEFWQELSGPLDVDGFYAAHIKCKQGKIFVASSGKLFISSDNGKNWICNETTFQGGIHCFDINPSGDIFVAFGYGLWKSTDNGLTYFRIAEEQFYSCIQSIVIKDDGTIYMHSWKEFAKSTNNGLSWDISIIEQNPRMERWNTLRLLKNGYIILQSDYGNLMKSTDDGKTWDQIHLVLDSNEIPFIVNKVDKNDVIYAIVDSSQKMLVKSTDYGNTWKFIYPCPFDYQYQEILPLSNGDLLIGASKDKKAVFHSIRNKKAKDITNELELQSEIYSMIESNGKVLLTAWTNSIHYFKMNLIIDKMLISTIETQQSTNDSASYKSINMIISANDKKKNLLQGAKVNIKNFYTGENNLFSTDTSGKVLKSIEYDLSINNFNKYIIDIEISHPDYDNTYYERLIYNICGINIDYMKKSYKVGEYFEINIKPYVKKPNNERENISDVYFMVYSPFTMTNEFLPINSSDSTTYRCPIPLNAIPGKYIFKIYAYKEGYLFQYATEEIVVRIATGIEDEIITNYQLLIAPNPAGEYIIAETSNLDVSTEITIYNVLGECVRTIPNTQTPKPQIYVSDLPSGIYFVRVGEFVGRFVKM